MAVPENAKQARDRLVHCYDIVVLAGMNAYESENTEAGEMMDQCAGSLKEAIALHDVGDCRGAALLVDSIKITIEKAYALLDKP